ncbi:hypothetical protein J2Z65_000020 [Paenibacillus aceris]|uniref:Uncharacterized protein n=1 Tax=Paenibacillus aceris TaxID=869555 RepID=A0ABS4HQD7_9BACL|nr:hypothetical protein [Paenibacillus aceris]
MTDQKNKLYMDIVNYVHSNSLSNNIKVDKMASGRVVYEYIGEMSDIHKNELKNLQDIHNSIK